MLYAKRGNGNGQRGGNFSFRLARIGANWAPSSLGVVGSSQFYSPDFQRELRIGSRRVGQDAGAPTWRKRMRPRLGANAIQCKKGAPTRNNRVAIELPTICLFPLRLANEAAGERGPLQLIRITFASGPSGTNQSQKGAPKLSGRGAPRGEVAAELACIALRECGPSAEKGGRSQSAACNAVWPRLWRRRSRTVAAKHGPQSDCRRQLGPRASCRLALLLLFHLGAR